MPSFWHRRQPSGSLEQAILRNPTAVRTKVSEGSRRPRPPMRGGACLSHGGGDSRHSSQARCFCGPAGAKALPGAMAEGIWRDTGSVVRSERSSVCSATLAGPRRRFATGSDRQGLGRGGKRAASSPVGVRKVSERRQCWCSLDGRKCGLGRTRNEPYESQSRAKKKKKGEMRNGQRFGSIFRSL